MEAIFLEASLRALVMAAGVAGVLSLLRIRSAAARHRAWMSVLIAMLLLPVWTAWGPRMAARVLPAPAREIVLDTFIPEPAPVRSEPARSSSIAPVRAMQGADSVPAKTWNWQWALWAVYFLGFTAMLIRLAAGTIGMHRVATKASPEGNVLRSKECTVPVTIGLLRPVVLVPEQWPQWPAAKQAVVLAHEQAHIRRRDPLVQWLALLNRAVFWFHPLSWWLARKLSALAEEVCDEAALRNGHAPVEYAEFLVELAQSIQHTGRRIRLGSAAIDGHSLSHRIERILNPAASSVVSRPRAIAAGVLCFSILSLCLACRPAAKSQLAPGQLTMNEMMHKRAAENQEWTRKWQAIEKEVKEMTVEQARELETQVKANPEDQESRRKLIRYYQHKVDLVSLNALTLWFIEHHPEQAWAHNLNPEWDPIAYDKAKRLWLAHLKRPGIGPEIYRNAARLLQGDDKPLAEQALLAGQKAHPDPQSFPGWNWSRDLGEHYALTLLGMNAPKTETNSIRSVNMKVAHSPYAQSVRARLAASTDADLLGSTADALLIRSINFIFSKENPLDFDPISLAESYLDRAQMIEPRNAGIRDLKASLNHLKISLYLRRTPQEHWTPSDRMKWLLSEIHNELFKKENSQAETRARELLALAAQQRQDPEYGTAIYEANLALGDMALRRGEKREAVQYLLAAAAAPPSENLRSAPLDMSLARQLVDWGEREAVAQYLEKLAQFNGRAQEFRKWAAEIRKGINPNLIPYRG